MGNMSIGEAQEIINRGINQYRAFEKMHEVLSVVANLEGEKARLTKENAELTQKLAALRTRVDEKQIELQETIDSMTSTAASESAKAQEALGKLKRHCDEQMKEIREKYVRDKDKMAREIGDLEGQRAQLVKAINKLKQQQQQLQDIETSQHLLKPTLSNGITPQQETLDKMHEARKKEMEKAVAKFNEEKRKLSEEIGNLQGQKAQLHKAVEKLRDSQVQLKARAVGDSA